MKKYYVVFYMIVICFAVSNAQLFDINKAQKENYQNEGYYHFDNPTTRYDSVGLDSFIRATMINEHIPGAATWLMKNGQVIWQHCYGYANLADSIPVADTTLFLIASISKTFVATAIMQLWENDKFELDDNINDHLPFNVRNPNYPDSIITFRMLMTHTSSINDNWGVLDPLVVWGGDSPISLDSFMRNYLIPGGAYYNDANFNTWAPGHSWDYCNVAVALLGYLVEVIADSFPIYCQDSIFTPLSMNETSWFLSGLNRNNIAVHYYWAGSYYLPYQHYGTPDYPDGQLRTSRPQLARHLKAFMQYGMIDSVRILDSTTVELMRTVQCQGPPSWEYGLIWQHFNLGTRWLWGHAGGGYGVTTAAFFCPEENSATIVLINSRSDDGIAAIMNALFDYAQQYSIEEELSTLVKAKKLGATIIRGHLQLPAGKNYILFDINGRKVADFKSEHNDIRHFAPGIYFLQNDNNSQATKIILTK